MTADETLAAEYALGLLEGEELLAARSRENSDPAFAADVARWQERLAPLADAVHPRMPREEVWQRIEAELAGDDGSAEVVTLRRSLRRWQWAGGLSAAAAVALAFLALPQLTGPGEPAPGIAQAPGSDTPLLAANMPIEGTPLSLDFTYLPEKDSLLVGAVGLTADGVHDHEIWFVPEEGDLVSLTSTDSGTQIQAAVYVLPPGALPKNVPRQLYRGSKTAPDGSRNVKAGSKIAKVAPR